MDSCGLPRLHTRGSLLRTANAEAQKIPGSLVALKPAMYLNPHCWHATTPWTGDRVLAIGYCLKATHKLRDDDRGLMKSLGFSVARNAPVYALRRLIWLIA